MFTLTQVVRSFAANAGHANRAAFVDDRTSSFAEFYRRSAQRAEELASKGVGRSDTIVVLTGNRVELLELLIASSLRGGKLLPLSKLMVAEELAEILRQAAPKTAYADEAYYERLCEAASGRTGLSVEFLSPVSAEMSLDDALDRQDLATPDADCWLATSSGSTGLPRIHRITHANLIGNLYANALEWGWHNAGVYVALAPLAHGIGFSHLVGQLVTGGPSTLLEPFEPEGALQAIARPNACWTAVVPTLLHDLVKAAKVQFPSVQLIICAGSPLFGPLVADAQSVFPNAEILEYYGSTEFGWATAIRARDRAGRPGAVGRPVGGVEIQVRDDLGNPLQRGQVGLVYKRGRPYSAGIVGGSSQDARFEPTDWQSAGDLGLIDDDGYLHLKDRRGDMIISGGLNVYPSEVERVILEHPSVRECVVVGVPDERWGERVCAVLSHDSPDHGALIGELESRCAEHLASYKRPKEYIVWESLPRSGPGKTSRPHVRAVLVGEPTQTSRSTSEEAS